MNLSSLVASRPVLVFIILAFLVLIFPSVMVPVWYKTNQRTEQNASWFAKNLESGLAAETEAFSQLLHQTLNSSAQNFARVLGSSLKQSDPLTFSEIQTKVAPFLFQAYSIIPHVAHASYTGSDGVFFSFFTSGNQTLAMYANSTATSVAGQEGMNRTWYLQRVEPDTGYLVGKAMETQPMDATTADYLQGAMYATNGNYAALGTGPANGNETMILNTIALKGKKGAMTLGFPVKALTDFISGINFHASEAYIFTVDGKMLLGGSKYASLIFNSSLECLHLLKPHYGEEANVSVKGHCWHLNGTAVAIELELGDSKHQLYSSVTDTAGMPLVYILALPQKELVSLVKEDFKWEVIVISLMAIATSISIITFVCLIGLSAKREKRLCATLINQMEATQQAERKSMNKSQALAKASHDIRVSLSAITGLIEHCYDCPSSEMESILEQMQECSKDLLELLNSILDINKIEAGKMQLDEEEFNLAQLLEDVMDSFHPVAMKNGVDVVLDPHDGSVLKFAKVQGDRAKLKQILNNLMSNAVKFTSEGHVTLKAWAQKPSFASSIALASSQKGGMLKHLPWPFGKQDGAEKHDNGAIETRKNSNTMEFVFEVDDTGRGIPKEKHKSIFENYVQVRETARGQQGTGLGLGIVQSLVRLMGGEIGIVEKETGHKGTCFRFNVFLTTCDSATTDPAAKSETEARSDSSLTPQLGLTIRTSSPSFRIRSLSPRLTILGSSPKIEGSRVVLLIGNEERRRVTHNFLQKLGINVTVVESWEYLSPLLQRMKSKLNSPTNSMGSSESGSKSGISSSSSKGVPLSALDGSDHKVPLHKRKGSSHGCVLLIIDATAGPYSELCNVVGQFREGLRGASCKLVLLNKPINRRAYGTANMDEDMSFLNPLHASRLIQAIKLLPEFGGTVQTEVPAKPRRERTSNNAYFQLSEDKEIQQNKMLENKNLNNDKELKGKAKSTLAAEHRVRKYKGKSREHEPLSMSRSHERGLRGKVVLVAEDTTTNARIAKSLLLKHACAKVDLCGNGAEAVALVKERLKDFGEYGSSNKTLPYDCILMDCQMPVMDGFEATRKIREEERYYGIHTPIIALTAHSSGAEAREIIEAGMDAHLTKPLNIDRLMETIGSIQSP